MADEKRPMGYGFTDDEMKELRRIVTEAQAMPSKKRKQGLLRSTRNLAKIIGELEHWQNTADQPWVDYSEIEDAKQLLMRILSHMEDAGG